MRQRSSLPLRPRFIGGGDLETLSLYRLLFGGTGLKDFLAPRRGGLGDREYEAGRPLRAGEGDTLAGLVLFGGGDRESYEDTDLEYDLDLDELYERPLLLLSGERESDRPRSATLRGVRDLDRDQSESESSAATGAGSAGLGMF
ncbi:hypothetical protein HG530_003660 [Fusarium avenaceum]|nr:hypothetical protein HG530_003660 [Fusarium avenaceum]